MKKYCVSLFLALTIASPFLLTAGEAERKASNELLDVTHFEQVIGDSLNASIQMMKEMNPDMEKHEVTVRNFFDKCMDVKSLRKEMVDMYSEVFTASELNDIVAFYKTTTGQKAMEKLPEIMQKSMQVAQVRVMKNMGELQALLEKEMAPNKDA